MKQLKIKISEQINEILDKSDLWITRTELAKMAGISETTLYLVLKGKASVDYMLKVCKVLNIKIDIK